MPTFSTSDAVQLHYELIGKGHRVFVSHGGPANDYRYLAEDLAVLDADFEFVFCDYRGSGRSDPAPPATYRIERLADDLDELRRHLGGEQILLLGHSMGGYVAQAYALQHPEHLGRLVLVGTWPASVPSKLLPGMVRAMGWRRVATMLARAMWWIPTFAWRPRSQEGRRCAYAIWATSQEGLPAVRARELEREFRLGMPLHNDNIKALQREFRAWDLAGRLDEITCPVLVLYGERDAAAVASAELYRTSLHDVQLHRLAEIGHDVFFEAPATASRYVRLFLTAT